MDKHLKSICKSSHYHIRNIAKFRKYIDEESAKIVVHAFVTAKLDSCNSLLYGLPKHLLSRLQSIQNTAARVVTCTRKFDHITPVLREYFYHITSSSRLLSTSRIYHLPPLMVSGEMAVSLRFLGQFW